NTLVDGVDARLSLHVCYGNRYGKPSWEGSYRYLFPAILEARIHQITLEFARRGSEDLRLFKEFDAPFTLGLGVVDVKTHDVETRLLEAASGLARISAVVAGSVTSYAGGAMGHDPLRVAAAARARGLTPNIHLTCVSQDRLGLAKSLDDMHALSLENVFALTGDYPGAGDQPPVFDLDSVQLVRLIDERRRGGIPFHVAVAVSPFKYTEADCVYQYVKLEKKIAAGADVAVTQVGWDAPKFAELKRYLDERGLRTPLLGNVYVLGPKTAERMATGRPP